MREKSVSFQLQTQYLSSHLKISLAKSFFMENSVLFF